LRRIERRGGCPGRDAPIKGLIMKPVRVCLWVACAALLWGAGTGLAQQAATTGLPTVAASEPTGPVDLIAAPFPMPAPPSTVVRVAILDASASLQRAGSIAVLLTHFRKRELEEHIGMKIELANVSRIPEQPLMGNVVFYRPEFLRAAALLAKAIPGEQSVRVMPPERMAISGVDVEILLGEGAP
jgi:hypothetical protein